MAQYKITTSDILKVREFSNAAGMSFTEGCILFYGDSLFKLHGISKKSKMLVQEFDEIKKYLYASTDKWDRQLYKTDLELLDILLIQSLEHDLRSITGCAIFID